MSATPPPAGPDYAAIAAMVEHMREMVGALVAGFVGDGFTDREARQLAVAFFAPAPTESTEPEV